MITGHVMLDEIKLKNGISFNCKSKEIIRFLPDQMNTKNMFENILKTGSKQKNWSTNGCICKPMAF